MVATGAQDDVCQREVEIHRHIPMDFQLRGWIVGGFVFGPIPNDPLVGHSGGQKCNLGGRLDWLPLAPKMMCAREDGIFRGKCAIVGECTVRRVWFLGMARVVGGWTIK